MTSPGLYPSAFTRCLSILRLSSPTLLSAPLIGFIPPTSESASFRQKFIKHTLLFFSGEYVMGRIGRGWQLTKVSLGVLNKDKEILLLPILSGIFSVLVFGVIFIPGLLFYVFEETSDLFLFRSEEVSQLFLFLVYFLAYVAMTFVIVYFNAAVIGCARVRLEGGDPTLGDGFRIASKKLPHLFVWALISGTVGLIFRAFRKRMRLLSQLFEWAWGIVTFFVVPVILFENVSVTKSIGRSKDVITKTWGEAFVGRFGMGLLFILFGFLGLVFPIGGYYLYPMTGLAVGIIVAFVYWMILLVIYSAANGVLTAALYRYASTGKIYSDYPAELMQP